MSERHMTKIGIVVAIVLAVIGLAIVGFFVFFAIGLNAWGSNK
jgi:hypothetical protein